VSRPTTANWTLVTTASTPRLAASGIPKTISRRAIARSKPYFTGTRPKTKTKTPVTTAPATCPQAKLNGPAPPVARLIAIVAFTTRPAMLATTSRPCWKVRISAPLRTAVTPSMTMVSASSRTTGAASALPAASAKAGAARKKMP
jgi:hypothetical protein